MKRMIIATISLLLTFTMYAQSNITTFMGIPVNGTKSYMTKQLIKKGAVKKGDSLLITNGVKNHPYLIKILTHKGQVFRVSMTETKGTKDAEEAIQRFEALIQAYRNNKPEYCEYEINRTINAADSLKKEYIHQGCFYAEFFQKAEPQLYTKRMAFRITDEHGDYRIEKWFDNIFNMPHDK